MSAVADIPAWLAWVTAALVLIGAGLTLIGSFGLLRLTTFYARVHAPTLGTTLGAGSILIASMLFFSVLQTRFVLHEILITVFVTLTTPVTLMLLTRAAMLRDQAEGNPVGPKDREADSEKDREAVLSPERQAARD
jgi:multicomponent K+:H+ antiporter subunit G